MTHQPAGTFARVNAESRRRLHSRPSVVALIFITSTGCRSAAVPDRTPTGAVTAGDGAIAARPAMDAEPLHDACHPSERTCGTACTDVRVDSQNCGRCGNRCPISCANGECTKVTAIAAGAVHTCARVSDGTVRCWGHNESGQLGDGTKNDSVRPVLVKSIATAVSIAASASSTCTVLSDETVRCWGNTVVDGDAATTTTALPIVVSPLSGVVKIALGGVHGCALLRDGRVKCWGDDADGELGNGTVKDYSTTAVVVAGIDNAIDVTAGSSHSCALLRDGRIECWGGNESGQLGNGGTISSASPVTVALGRSRAVAIAAGDDHTCATLSDGDTKCWGLDLRGQLGMDCCLHDGFHCMGMATFATPVPVQHFWNRKVISLVAGGAHTCALSDDGLVNCWGNNSNGHYEYRTHNSDSTCAQRVDDLLPASAVGAGEGHTCALLTDGSVRCWGFNRFGQLGNGTTIDAETPVAVAW